MLTPSQKTALKAYIEADATLNALPRNGDGYYEMARLLNLEVTPAFTVWKTSVPVEDIMRNGMDWTRVDNLTVGKSRIWDWMTKLGTINASKTNIRAGIDAAWVGTAADLAVRATVYTHCKRNATVFEKLFATGTGTVESPATMVLESPVSYQDVGEAINS